MIDATDLAQGEPRDKALDEPAIPIGLAPEDAEVDRGADGQDNCR